MTNKKEKKVQVAKPNKKKRTTTIKNFLFKKGDETEIGKIKKSEFVKIRGQNFYSNLEGNKIVIRDKKGEIYQYRDNQFAIQDSKTTTKNKLRLSVQRDKIDQQPLNRLKAVSESPVKRVGSGKFFNEYESKEILPVKAGFLNGTFEVLFSIGKRIEQIIVYVNSEYTVISQPLLDKVEQVSFTGTDGRNSDSNFIRSWFNLALSRAISQQQDVRFGSGSVLGMTLNNFSIRYRFTKTMALQRNLNDRQYDSMDKFLISKV